MRAELLELANPMQRALYIRTLGRTQQLPLEPEELMTLASLTRPCFFKRGEVMIERGAPPRATFLIVRGTVGGRFQGRKLDVVKAGEGIGLLATLAESNDMHAHALEDTVAIAIPSDAWQELFEQHFGFLDRVLTQMVGWLIEIFKGFPELVFQDPGEPGPDVRVPIPLVHRLLALRRWAVFNTVGLDALAGAARGMLDVEIPQGTVLWENGDGPSDRSLLIIHGIVDVHANGRVFRVGNGFTVGALDAIGGVPRWYKAVARTRIIGLYSLRETMLDLLEDNTDMGIEFLRNLASTLLTSRAQSSKALWKTVR